MFLRFVVDEIDERTEREKGLFAISYDLLRLDLAPEYQLAEIWELLNWFSDNLPIPKKFSRRKFKGDKETKGLGWIKSDAKYIIEKLFHLKDAIERQGYNVKIIKTKHPGYIVYEDDYQIVAEPFNNF